MITIKSNNDVCTFPSDILNISIFPNRGTYGTNKVAIVLHQNKFSTENFELLTSIENFFIEHLNQDCFFYFYDENQKTDILLESSPTKIYETMIMIYQENATVINRSLFLNNHQEEG